tara:strand:- start:351 stop:527 length:177 start_codon:yes stop_codon:yes gene_type:complete
MLEKNKYKAKINIIDSIFKKNIERKREIFKKIKTFSKRKSIVSFSTLIFLPTTFKKLF